MFWIFKKRVNEESIKAFSAAINAINVYIDLFEYEKARNACKEVIFKEKKSLEHYLENTKDKKSIIEKRKKELEEKEEKIKSLLEKISIFERDFNENEKKIRFKARFDAIKRQINNLLSQWKANEAMIVLNNFYEENQNEVLVFNFYKQQKNIIQEMIDKKMWRLEDRIKASTELEAMNLIWEEITEKEIQEKLEKLKEVSFIERIKKKFLIFKALKKKREEKKLFNEVSILIEEDNKLKKELAEKKLQQMHSWLVKELVYDSMIWYDLYWKILWADKISWDTFGLEENKENYLMFLGDATWHWIKAGFIISLLNKILPTLKDKKIIDIYYELNNQLKQWLESKNFVTWALFEINKESSKINYAWMWHEPILIYREKTKTVEKKVLGWIAAWIRTIKNISDIKIKNIDLDEWDILMIFSDWVVESKWRNWEFYNIDILKENFEKIANSQKNIKKIYELLIDDIKYFRGGSKFDDDLTILMLKRNTEKDLVKIWDEVLDEIGEKENLAKEELKKLEMTRKADLNKKLEAIRKEKETKRVIWILENLYYSWEILQLKQEAIRFIKEWFIHKKINHYLTIAIENENQYKIEQKNQKMQNKYNVLVWLYKKWDYDTVIKELEYIILRDWNF